MKQISSLQNPEIKFLIKLKLKKYQQIYNAFLVENIKDLELALEYKKVIKIYTTNANLQIKSFKNEQIILISHSIMKKITSYESASEVVALCNKLDVVKLENFLQHKRIVILENIQDPGNLGTIIRNCSAFDFALIYSGVDFYNSKVISASKGAIFKTPILKVENLSQILDKLHQNNFVSIGTFLSKKAAKIKDFVIENEQKYAIIFGNESSGISAALEKIIQKQIYIPIAFESLNIANATAILLYEFSTQNYEKRK
ncbi:TrmH family RNA methyltransferase [Mesomycoplasma hyorhinis]|uniref:RNA methyltransferase n=4 Tax=Mesomycoplasma hyorhinis TaxID=2100 RepID=A0ABD6IDF3_MESHY|nr:RNA methyltransferase [Mesomycoplasma hyorhinis]AEC45623.1 putative tRNA/rRNA methyltransferase [Mesomycoplasma hyorhinis MCLD]AEX14036.1 RNA methyltransferase, TrmH family [Mesomycoplasma hyorhinis GDL-1]AFX74288.1 rRNA methylase [Mesomycoplasma hyorhinis SK76]AHA41026.1 rRNA Methylase family protein SpoU [Mesomycoplasma hyorhinis DBS 1050]TRM75875.1 RNA methyltransferase [Sulfolobus sp. A20-N-F8]TRM84339.1 RNA methyltransferase [Sulfolobus sp. A20-N-F6]CRH24688.1 4.2.3 [Chlamydia tracho